MVVSEASKQALGDLRVLDLADEKGVYCAKLLADLGADVIKVEPPGGDPIRNIGPFFHDEPHPEKSLSFFALNTGKRGATLNIHTVEGRDIFQRLVETADVLVETYRPGYLDGLGLGYEALSRLNPRLIVTSITPFGQTGPWKDLKAPDLVAQALAGLMYICGFPEDPPNLLACSQAYYLASINAAVGTLLALYYRDLTGEGQQVDVSMQEAAALAQNPVIDQYNLHKAIFRRTGLHLRFNMGRAAYPCKDGYVYFAPPHRRWGELVAWLDSEGMAQDLNEERWLDPEYRQREMRHIEEVWAAFLAVKTREQISRAPVHDTASVGGALTRQDRLVWGTPVNTTEDVLRDPQLLARGYFVDVDHPELDTTIRYPGAPYRLSETPWHIRCRAPMIGEHNLAIYEGELGIPRKTLVALKAKGAI